MGVQFEYNWFLVTTLNDIYERDDFLLINKKDKRIYPVGVPIPLIIKGEGCIGMALIKSFKVDERKTEIEFMITDKFSVESEISKHYYNGYLNKK